MEENAVSLKMRELDEPIRAVLVKSPSNELLWAIDGRVVSLRVGDLATEELLGIGDVPANAVLVRSRSAELLCGTEEMSVSLGIREFESTLVEGGGTEDDIAVLLGIEETEGALVGGSWTEE